MCLNPPDVSPSTPIKAPVEESADELVLGTEVPTGARQSARSSLQQNRQAGPAQAGAR